MSVVTMPDPDRDTRDIVRQVAVVVALGATLFVNYLANALPLGGRTTGEISDAYPNFFTPPGYVFAVWGAIYLGLLGYALYQALPAKRGDARLRRIGWLFVLSSALNGAWIFLWHFARLRLTLVVMVALLVTLIAIYVRLDAGRGEGSRADRWLVEVPFSLYLAWISIATIANTTVVLLDAGWNGGPLPPQAWSAIMITVGAALAAHAAWWRRDAAWVAVTVWAYVGIVVGYADVPLVAFTAAATAALVVATLGLSAWRTARRGAPAS